MSARKKVTVTAKDGVGELQVDGYIVGALALTRPLDGTRGWVLTHIASGLAISRYVFHSQGDAREVAILLQDIPGIDWSDENPAVRCPNAGALVHEVLQTWLTTPKAGE